MPRMQCLGHVVARFLRHRLVLLFMLIGAAYLFSTVASARPPSPGKVPNGNVYYCGTCHESGHMFSDGSPPVPSTPVHGADMRDPFGSTNPIKTWTLDLANQDSDGDGFTNGEELQDPAGAWAQGQPDPGDAAFVSNPSDGNPANDSNECSLAYRATPPPPLLLSVIGAAYAASGDVSFGVSARSPLPIDFVRYTIKNAANQTVFDQFSVAAPFRSPLWDTRDVPDGAYSVTAQVVEQRAKTGATPRDAPLSATVMVDNSAPSVGPRGEVIGTPANPCGIPESLEGVAAVSASDIWAVGTRFINGPGPRMLIKHWDGVRWTSVISPNVGTDDNLLHTAAASGASDVWAVGEYFDGSGIARTLTLHWDGARWQVVASPNVSPNAMVTNNRLFGVAALGPGSAWAVGSYDQDTSSHPLILRWSGAAWQSVTAPEPPGATNLQLNGIAAVSAGDAWAVGTYLDASFNRRTLILRWNGAAWSIVASPNPNDFLNALNAVAASAADDVWAVGYTSDGTGYKTLALHWNGVSWQTVDTPSPGDPNNELLAVAAAGPDDVWAFGYGGISADNGQTLALHWDGSAWSAVTRPDAANGALSAAARLPGGDIWAAGADNTGGTARTLVERYGAARPTYAVYLPLTMR